VPLLKIVDVSLGQLLHRPAPYGDIVSQGLILVRSGEVTDWAA
jgi:hypothetical protein